MLACLFMFSAAFNVNDTYISVQKGTDLFWRTFVCYCFQFNDMTNGK
jgi:hypothetical protein